MLYTLKVCIISDRTYVISKIYSSREIIKQLKDDGWYEVRITGSHHHFKHIELMVEDDEPIHKASSLDAIMKLPDAKGCVPLIISIIAPSGKAQRINITMDSALLHALDLEAANQHKTRSALLAEAAQRLLGEL